MSVTLPQENSKQLLPPVCGYKLLIQVLEVEKVSSGGIVLAEDYDATERKRKEAGRQYGRLVGIGPLAWTQFGDGAPWAKLNDIVFFSRYSGPESRIRDNLYFTLNDEDIHLTIPEELLPEVEVK